MNVLLYCCAVDSLMRHQTCWRSLVLCARQREREPSTFSTNSFKAPPHNNAVSISVVTTKGNFDRNKFHVYFITWLFLHPFISFVMYLFIYFLFDVCRGVPAGGLGQVHVPEQRSFAGDWSGRFSGVQEPDGVHDDHGLLT